MRCVILVSLVFSPSAFGERRSVANAEVRELLRQVQSLQYRLDGVAAGQGRYRYLQGGLFLASVGYLYGVYLAEERLTSGDVEVIAKGVVGTTGVIFGVGGLLTLLFPGEAESLGDRYRAIPAKNLMQLKLKLDRGEAELRRAANRARVSNNLIGAGLLTVGVADLIWFLGTGPNTDLNFLAYLGGLYSAMGIALMWIESPAEAEWKDYQQSKTRIPSGSASGGEVGIFPQPGGASMAFRLKF